MITTLFGSILGDTSIYFSLLPFLLRERSMSFMGFGVVISCLKQYMFVSIALLRFRIGFNYSLSRNR